MDIISAGMLKNSLIC